MGGSDGERAGKMGWTGDIKVIEGGTHEIIRTHAGYVAGLVKSFWESLAE